MKRKSPAIGLLTVIVVSAMLFVFSLVVVVPLAVDKALCSIWMRAKSDMRSYATGIESYFVDNNAYPPAVPMKSYIKTSDADEPWASRLMIPGRLTTPIAYVTSYFPDPYGPVKGATFNYYAGAKGWILVSPGPDWKYDIDPARDYDSSETQPSARLLQKCFDPTNGTISQGDIVRVKQW